jgi:hypothetical protein
MQEFANLECNSIDNLFTEKGITRFFPRYDSIEYYFTGMFVNNLLLDRKPVDNYY